MNRRKKHKSLMVDEYIKDLLVSIIIPVYNDGDNLIAAVDSAINQVGVTLEVIVVDDSSTQNIRKIISRYLENQNVTYIRNSVNMGVAKSRNIGVTKAKGDYIAYLDSDDWWDCDKLRRQIEIVYEKNADIVCTGRELALDNGTLTGKLIHVNREIEFEMLIKHNSIACSSVLIKRELALKYPMHNDEYHEDYINWLEITKDKHKVYGIDEPLLKYRMSVGGKSRNRLKSMYMTYKSYQIVGLGRLKAVLCTCSHVINGIKKYKCLINETRGMK